MRIIKFRAWDKEYRRFLNGDFSLGIESGEFRGKYGEVFTNIDISQFTGLHDKNGKEIYEGDIVTDGVGKYKIVYDLKLAGYQPYCIFRDDPENYCEVIGNIYENPELISKTPTHEH